MSTITPQSEQYLNALVEELEIPASMYDKAEKSYSSLGDWFHRDDSTIKNYAPSVYVQGSFRLGTAIRPTCSGDEYDVDCACVLEGLRKTDLSQSDLKERVGREVKSYRSSKNIEKPVSPGRRCWTLEYSDDAKFHMDIVPAIPNGSAKYERLKSLNLETKYADTAISITDNEELPQYNQITDDWPGSNPLGYAKWFEGRMGEVFIQKRAELYDSMRLEVRVASVDEIPVYKVKTPLQSVIMILKQHRDIMFESDTKKRKPISIILSTLAAHAYQGETNLAEALVSILNRMESFVRNDGKKYFIENPTDGTENFADKWEKHPERAEAFFEWLSEARKDFYELVKLADYSQMEVHLEKKVGSRFTSKARINAQSQSSRLGGSLLRASSAAPLTSPTVSFADVPRVPKKPAGFA